MRRSIRKQKIRRLIYDDIMLVPVVHTPNSWHLPGGGIATTRELAERARKRDLSLELVTREGLQTSLETLN